MQNSNSIFSKMPEGQNPEVSLIMATHNRADLLPSAVESILQQTFNNFELLIVDDASQDETYEVMQALCEEDERIRIFRNSKNLGNGPTRNVGLKASRGEFIAIMDDDDLSLPHRFETQLNVLNNGPSIDLVFSTVNFIDDELNILSLEPKSLFEKDFSEDPQIIFEDLYTGNCDIINSTIMFRRSIYEKVGGYGTTSTGPDRFFFMKVMAMGFKSKAILKPLVLVRRHEDYKSHIQAKRGVVYKNKLKNVKLIRQWLRENDISEFDHLHKLALSNALARYARSVGGFRGLWISIRAFLTLPKNSIARRNLRAYVSKMIRKITPNFHNFFTYF